MQSNKTQPASNQNQPATPRVALAGQTGGTIRVVLELLFLLVQAKRKFS